MGRHINVTIDRNVWTNNDHALTSGSQRIRSISQMKLEISGCTQRVAIVGSKDNGLDRRIIDKVVENLIVMPLAEWAITLGLQIKGRRAG